jgi:hypothetical protein
MDSLFIKQSWEKDSLFINSLAINIELGSESTKIWQYRANMIAGCGFRRSFLALLRDIMGIYVDEISDIMS